MEKIDQTPKPIEKPVERTLILKTDGTNVHIEKSELSNLELMSICSILLNKLQNN